MKKILLGLLAATALSFSGCSTSDPDVAPDANQQKELTDEELAKEPVFTEVDQQPEYPGGIQAMYTFLGTNIRYPTEASKNRIQGKVFLTFVIGSTGKVREVEVVKGVSESLDQESMRVIKMMPKWTPARKDGKAVASRYNLPISFVLEG